MTVLDIPKSAQKVSDFLQANASSISGNIEFKVVMLEEGTRTAQQAADTIGCEVAQICKSIIFKSADGKPVLVLASGANRINEKLIAEYLGQKIGKADPAFTREITGYAIGGIPPVAHAQEIENIFIDEDLGNYDSIWAAAGTPNTVFELNYQALIDLTKGTVQKIK